MDATTSIHAAALWVGLHLILLLILSLLVVRQRQTHEVLLGDDGVPELTQAIRAFGNATEYIPAAMISLAVLAMLQAPTIVIHIGGGVLFVGRVTHAIGLSFSGGATFPRAMGIVITWIAYVVLSAALLFYAIA